MRTSSGRKILLALSTPSLTPSAVTTRPKAHTNSSGMATPTTTVGE